MRLCQRRYPPRSPLRLMVPPHHWWESSCPNRGTFERFVEIRGNHQHQPPERSAFKPRLLGGIAWNFHQRKPGFWKRSELLDQDLDCRIQPRGRTKFSSGGTT